MSKTGFLAKSLVDQDAKPQLLLYLELKRAKIRQYLIEFSSFGEDKR